MTVKKDRFLYIFFAVFFVEFSDTLNALIRDNNNAKDEMENLKLSFREITESYFPTLKDITVISDNSTRDKIDSFVVPAKGIIHVTWDKSQILPLTYKYEMIVMILSDLKKMNESLSLKFPFWTSATKFIVIHNGDVKKEVFKIFWKVRAVNVLLLTVESDEKVLGFGYSPYEKCHEITEVFMVL